MLKEEFIKYRNEMRFPNTIFKLYYEEVSEKPWHNQAFDLYITQNSMLNPNFASDIINKVIVPYYTAKFELYGKLEDKKGNLIKYIDEKPEITETNK